MFREFKIQRSLWLGRIFAAALVTMVLVGCVISPRRLPGDIVPGTTPTPTPTPTTSPTPTPTPVANGKLYVSNANNNSILRFDNALTTSGNVAPAATIVGAATTLSAPAFMTLDTTADRLYVANNGNFSILIFDNISTKTGNVAPSRTITGNLTNLFSPTDVAVDTTRDLLYVADDVDIFVFSSASTANGNVAPLHDISPGFRVSAIFIDSANNRLYAADHDNNAIAVFDNASTLDSTVTAPRTIQGAATNLGAPSSVQLDGLGRLVVSNVSPASITIFNNAATATGNIAPSAQISGASTGLNVPDQIVVDKTGNGTLYNADPGAARIAIYGNLSTATGNLAPTRTISGASTTLTVAGQPVGVAIDTTR
ncbi:MAG TPA: hypothetical protein VFB79_01060 [Candidatus Angelobacter sp.]|nr:hypothetical protein [Candidatus Angelobacter sp.]